MGSTTSRRTRVGSVIGVAALALVTAASVLVGAAGPVSAYDRTHTEFKGAVDRGDPGMGQTNGPVLTLETVDGQVVAGGNFTSTRPAGAAAGTGETGQGFLAAFDASTGQPSDRYSADLSFQDCQNCPNVEDPVVRATALSPDGSVLYVGGDFNRVDGQVANYVARFDTRTGAYLGSLGRSFENGRGTDGPVHALAVSPDGTTLYAGGTFARAGDRTRRFVAAFDLTTNQVDESFAPNIQEKLWNQENVRVIALGVSRDGGNVLIGGTFGRSNQRPVQGFTAVDATTGKNLQGRWKEPYLRGNRTWATVIESGRDGTIYVGARSDSRGDLKERTEGVYRLNDATGQVRWYARCYGDTYAIQPTGNDVYVGSHAHDCERAGGMPEQRPRVRLAVHALNRSTGVVRPYFVLTSGNTEKTRFLSRAFTVDPASRQLVMGGGYLRVNGELQTNLVRFARGSASPARSAYPRVSTCRRCNAVQVRFTSSFDQDDIDLRYDVLRTRGGRTTRIRTIRRQSFFYARRTVSVKDTGTRRGQRVSYKVRVSDPAGNQLTSTATKTITVGRP